MNITLSPQLKALVRRKVDSGRYRSADDVVEEALGLLDERDRSDTFRTELERGFDQLDRGEGVLWTPEVMDRLKREAVENSRLGKQIKEIVKP